MDSKNRKENETSNFNLVNRMVTPEVVADVVECSPVTVRKVLNGSRSADTDLGQNIQIAKMLLDEGSNKLLQEVKKLVCF